MRFHKFISVLLHPVVIPTIGIVLFLALTPNSIPREVGYFLLSIIFFTTYVIPLVFLFFLKHFKLIKSLQLTSISERKIPVFMMLIIFYILGSYLIQLRVFKELGILFHGTNMTLVVVYILFLLKIKTSLHVISMSSLFGFFLMYCTQYNIPMMPIGIPLLLLTGLLASSRLILKAHTPREVYIAFFLGISSQCLAFMLLQ